jgi:hypothetical protein
MVFVYVSIHFRIWTRIRIRNPRVTDPDPAKVPDPCGSGSTTLICIILPDNSSRRGEGCFVHGVKLNQRFCRGGKNTGKLRKYFLKCTEREIGLDMGGVCNSPLPLIVYTLLSTTSTCGGRLNRTIDHSWN